MRASSVCRCCADREGDEGRREKCIEAGASDYLTKPIDADQLLTMLQAWLAESQFGCVPTPKLKSSRSG